MADDAHTYRRIPLEVFNDGRVELVEELLSEDFVEHAAPPGWPTTRDVLTQFVTGIRAAFPDFRYEILGQWQDGDMHIGWLRASGTMSGDFMGMPASGKSATWEETHIGRFAGGKLAEHWAVIDQLGMLTQLGFIPPMGGPPA
jgi:predicted ester cyclase